MVSYGEFEYPILPHNVAGEQGRGVFICDINDIEAEEVKCFGQGNGTRRAIRLRSLGAEDEEASCNECSTIVVSTVVRTMELTPTGHTK